MRKRGKRWLAIGVGVLGFAAGVAAVPAGAQDPPPTRGHATGGDATIGPLIAGRSSYVDGTFVSTDYAYDDRGPDSDDRPGGDATYPEGMAPNNVADLIQVQVRPVRAGTELTVVLETLTPETKPVIAIAFDSDGSSSTGPAALPGSWRPARALGVDRLFVLRRGGGAVRAGSGERWSAAGAFPVAVDDDANTLRATVPFTVPASGALRVVAAAGYADATGRSWLDGASPVHDLAYVPGESPVAPYLESVTGAIVNFVSGGDNVWQDFQQSAILAGEADPAPAVAAVDVARLRARTTHLARPDTKGFHTLLYRSDLRLGEGVQGDGNAALYAGPYQPYLVWVPARLRPGLPLVVYMHGSSQTHLSGVNTSHYDRRSQDPVLGIPDHFFDFEAVVAWPLGRGPELGYTGASERDVLDVTDDVVERLALDRDRVMLAGLSMGGIGTFRLAELYPDRWSLAYSDVGIDQTGLPENLTALPVRFHNGAADYLVNVALALQTRQLVDAAGTVDYRSWLVHAGHHRPAVALAECVYREAFARRRVANPARVRYGVDPSMFVDDAETGLRLRYEGAYWVSGMRPAGAGRAAVDLTSSALGTVPVPGPTTRTVHQNVTEGRDFCGPNAEHRGQDTWDEQARSVRIERRPIERVVRGRLAGLSAVTIAADRAGIPTGRVELTGDGPVTLTLTGLRARTAVTAGGRRSVAGTDGVARIILEPGATVVTVG